MHLELARLGGGGENFSLEYAGLQQVDHIVGEEVRRAFRKQAEGETVVVPGLTDHDFDHLPGASFPIAKLPGFIRLHEEVAGLVAPSRVVGIALNTTAFDN